MKNLILTVGFLLSMLGASQAQAHAVATGLGNQWVLRYGNRGYTYYLDGFVRGCQSHVNNNEYLERETARANVLARSGVYAVIRLDSYRSNSGNFTACVEY